MRTATAQPRSENEQADHRMTVLNSLLTTPHRKLTEIQPFHSELINTDPLFYVRLAAWYVQTGEIRDHKEMFIIMLCMSDFEGHRNVGLAMLRNLPPYQVCRVVDFIRAWKTKVLVKTKVEKKTSTTRTFEKIGLNKPVPTSLKTEVERYLREREADDQWFDATVLTARKNMKMLYRHLRIKPSERANKILFQGDAPAGSRLESIGKLRAAKDPADQAKIIIEEKIPYRTAATIVSAMTPTVLLALITNMSDQELLNNLGSLQQRGAMDNAELKLAINQRLDGAKKSGRVAALKNKVTKENTTLDQETIQKLDDVADSQLKMKGRIKRSTAIFIDKSMSMQTSIEIGKHVASMLSAVMDAPLHVIAFDTMPYPIASRGSTLADWDNALKGIKPGGGTSCGCPINLLRSQNITVEQIVMISDQEEVNPPRFIDQFKAYSDGMAVKPHVVFLRCGKKLQTLEAQCRTAGYDHDAYDFSGDYYSLGGLIDFLSKNSKLDLLMEIMNWELPVRRAA